MKGIGGGRQEFQMKKDKEKKNKGKKIRARRFISDKSRLPSDPGCAGDGRWRGKEGFGGKLTNTEMTYLDKGNVLTKKCCTFASSNVF